MKKPTPTQIKQSGVLGEHFFSRRTMQFCGQRMTDFKTEWACREQGIVRLYAPCRDWMGGKTLLTERWVKVDGDSIRGSFIWSTERRITEDQKFIGGEAS